MSLPWYFWILLVLYVVVSFIMVGVILLQAGKGGGMSSLMGGGGGISDSLGTTSAEKTFKKFTKICAVSFCCLAIILTVIGSRHAGQSSLAEELEQKSAEEAALLPTADDEIPVPFEEGLSVPEEDSTGLDETVDETEAVEIETVPAAEAEPVE